MQVSQKLAIAAHLHVLLRRKTGRVTDTEWMASNLEYALEIVRFTRAKADEEGHDDLHEWADKLEAAALSQPAAPHRALVQSAMHLLRERAPAMPVPPAPVPTSMTPRPGGFSASVFPEGFSDSILDPDRTEKPKDPAAPRYVGGIR